MVELEGRSNEGRRGRDETGKGRGTAYIPPDVPSNFSAVVVPMNVSVYVNCKLEFENSSPVQFSSFAVNETHRASI